MGRIPSVSVLLYVRRGRGVNSVGGVAAAEQPGVGQVGQGGGRPCDRGHHLAKRIK